MLASLAKTNADLLKKFLQHMIARLKEIFVKLNFENKNNFYPNKNIVFYLNPVVVKRK